MHASQGLFDAAHQIQPLFLRIALEYISDPNAGGWIHVPHVVTLRNPDDERFIRQARRQLSLSDAFARAGALNDLRFHRRNWLIEMRERIPEVMAALKTGPHVVGETITRLGLQGDSYLIGAQFRLHSREALTHNPDMRHCTLEPITQNTVMKLLQKRRTPRLKAA